LKFADKIYGCTLEEGETKILSVELPKEWENGRLYFL
jgi:hypothetical protein